MERPYEEYAERFVDAIVKLADSPVKLDNLECYLAQHFGYWLTRYARTSADITRELEHFAGIEFDKEGNDENH